MESSENKQKLVIPALGGIYDAFAPCTQTALRVAMGLLFIPHGAQKLFGAFGGATIEQYTAGFGKALGPAFASPGWVYYIGSLEFFGGILLTIGLLTRPVALLFVGFMATAALVANYPNGWFWTRPGGGIETPIFWGIVCLIILIRGGGAWSVDRLIGKEV
jgi:putative oxidoreductase